MEVLDKLLRKVRMDTPVSKDLCPAPGSTFTSNGSEKKIFGQKENQ